MKNKITFAAFLISFRKWALWFLKSYLWIIPILFIIDLASKLIIESILVTEGNGFDVIPGFFRIALLYNTGAAWGSLDGNKILLVGVSLIGGTALSVYLAMKYKSLNWWTKAALFCMIPGAFGNLIDRCFYQKGVIDFFEFTFGSYVFPTFNIADSCLVVGVIILIVAIFIEDGSNRKIVKERIIKEREKATQEKAVESENNENNS